ncbi:MAG: hypothetical protein H6732_12320 [Alphaproteobacteria bacterium]|nr:hypothetical protein [Alphaproteobacteria bacterium]
MTWGALLGGALCTLGLASPAFAQDGMDFSFDLNSVLVATFEADQPFLEPESERVRGLVEDALGDAYVVVRMAEVPPFTDYSADIYLRSCPDGQYIGCVFVVGGRAETDWTIGGRVSAVEGGYQVDLSFIDVSDAKLVLEFDVVLDGSNDAEFKEGVVKVMDALVNGEVQQLDLRGDPEAQRRAEAEAEKREELSRKFAYDQVYEDPEDLERGDVGLDAYVGDDSSKGRVTFEDLEEMEESGGVTPWDRAGLTKAQYKLYRNSGKKLRDFKSRLQGRKGEILVRAGMKVSSGPWGQAHHTGVLLAAGTPKEFQQNPRLGDIVQQSALQLNTTDLVFGGELELAFGVAPFMDIGVFGGIHGSPYRWQFFSEIEGAPTRAIPNPTELDQVASRIAWYVGAKLGFAPMPAYPARPTLYVGGSYWQGTSVGAITSPIPQTYVASQMTGNNMILVHAQPGFEINAGKTVVIFARADIDLPVFGRTFQNNTLNNKGAYTRQSEFTQFYNGGAYRVDDADGAGPGPGVVNPNFAVGVGGTIGIMLRFRVAGLR